MGKIPNCLRYKNEYKCFKCKDGYQVFTSDHADKDTQFDTCMPIPQDDKCDNYKFNYQIDFGKTKLTTSLIIADCNKCRDPNGVII